MYAWQDSCEKKVDKEDGSHQTRHTSEHPMHGCPCGREGLVSPCFPRFLDDDLCEEFSKRRLERSHAKVSGYS